MNVSVLTYSTYGAFATVAKNIARGLEDAGIDVDVLFLSGDDDEAGFPANVRLIRIGTQSRTCWPSVARHLRRRRPRALISLGWVLNPAAIVAVGLARTGTPLILNEASSLSYKTRVEHRGQLNLRVLGPLARFLYPRAAVVTAVSEAVLADLEHEIGIDPARVPLIVVPNAVDGADVRLRSLVPDARLVTAEGNPLFVNVARHVRQKNLPLLLRAFGQYRAEGGLGRLVLVGHGPDSGRLQQMVHELALDADVVLRGGLANPFPQLAAATAFVSSSEEEGFGLAIVEAMALGVPVISTACPGGPREILQEGRVGLLVPSGDSQAMCDAMHRIASDASLRSELGLVGPHRAQDFAPAVVGRAWIDVIENACGVRGRRSVVRTPQLTRTIIGRKGPGHAR